MNSPDDVSRRHATSRQRARWQRAIAIATMGAILSATLAVHAEEVDADADGDAKCPIDETMRGDAALADIFFLDRTTGWAVGERGVIWHTADGGNEWREQVSPVDCRLASVWFVNERCGWIVGGAGEPYSEASHAVVLRTMDGGATWSAVPELRMPRLWRVKFFDAERGVAIGEATPAAPSGVYATHDGGRQWQALPASDAGGWQTGDFIDPNTGAVAGAFGRFANVLERRVNLSPLATPTLRTMRAMRLAPPLGGWLVGDGGLVMTTRDLGRSWQTTVGALPNGVSDHFDFYGVAAHGAQVWIVGAPGSRVLHSSDGGQTWDSVDTGHRAPLRAITFVDGEHGWAAGELGAILATGDGGRTWQVQRAGGRRAAMLGLVARASDVPLELVAEQGAEEGYLTAIDVLFASRKLAGNGVAGPSRWRTREAMILAGATSGETAWRFPLAMDDAALTPPDLIAALNRASDGRAMEQLESYLVRELRMWRPDVVVTHHGATDDSASIAILTSQLVRRALETAGDPAQHIELATATGLEAWRPKKVYGLLPPNVRGDEVVSTARFAPRLGEMLVDWTGPARQRLSERPRVPPEMYGLALIDDRTEGAEGPRGIFRGITLAYGGEARRPTSSLPVDNVDQLRRQAMRRKHLRALVDRGEGNALWAGQVAEMIDGLDDATGGELLFQLAEEYRGAGRLGMTADTMYLLGRRYPDHPLTSRALVWLVQYYASSELAHSALGARADDVRQRDGEIRPKSSESDGSRSPTTSEWTDSQRGGTLGNGVEHEVQPASATRAINLDAQPVVGLSRDERLRRAVDLGEYLEGAKSKLYDEPSVRFPLVVAQCGLGFANPAKRYYLSLRKLPENDAWRRCAETEQWLANPEGLPPAKTLGACRQISERPHLDGELDEAFWSTIERLRLKGDEKLGGALQLAHDREFLYLGIACAKASGAEYQDDDGPRPRDGDLAEHDRVVLRLDTDRDYTTSYEFVVDHRGWTHDACWGDTTWNPTWYVAAASDEKSWRVEAAIPLVEIVAEPPSAKHVWAASVERETPRVGTSAWSGASAAEDSPERFGLLIFE